MKPAASCVLAVDPGGSCGWALLNGQMAVLAVGLLRDASVQEIALVVDRCSAEAAKRSCGLELWVEDQFLGVNPKSYAKLVERRVQWEVLADLRNVRRNRVLPAQWQAAVLGHSGRGQLPRAEVQALSLRIVRSLYGANAPQQSDQAAAICIGRYAVTTMAMQARLSVSQIAKRGGV